MKSLSSMTRLLFMSAAALVAVSGIASAQIPIPFVTTVAGIPAGGSNAACTSYPTAAGTATGDGFPNWTGQTLGDGCLPTQATLLTLYDAQTDAAGDVFLTENGINNDIRVIYNGGATLAKMLVAANAAVPNFSLVNGHIYTLAGGSSSALKGTNKVYYCANIANGQQTTSSIGDNCPAAQGYIKPRGVAVDKYGNVYTVSNGGGDWVQVIYGGGAQVAALITTTNPGAVPQVGYMYTIAGGSTTGFTDNVVGQAARFVQLRYITVDNAGDIFVSDGNTQTGTSPNIYEVAGNNVRRIDGVSGMVTTFAGEGSCNYSSTTGCPYGSSGDGGPANAALLSTPYAIFLDAYSNLYIADYYNSKIRVVYEGGTIAGISNPTVGYIYTYAGGGSIVGVNGTPANQVKFANLYVAGIDAAGNIYAEDGTTKVVWKFDAKTAIGNMIAGGTASITARAGTACSYAGGPMALDNLGDGCPATQANLSDTGKAVFDAAGNMYLAENGTALVRKLSYDNQFAATAVGSTVSQSLAFEFLFPVTLSTESFSLDGSSTVEYADAGNTNCSPAGNVTVGTICVYNVNFKPAHDGQRAGSFQLTTTASTTPAVSESLSGVGVAADIAIDTGTQSTVGTGLAPAGVATDLLGNIYVSDTTGNRVLKGAANGTTLTPVITGLNKPTQIAVDGSGNLYVADSGNNRVLETTSAGGTIATLGSGLSGPKGVAVDGLGNVYVADTGNNRVLQVFANGYQSVLPLTGISAPTELALDATGDLFVLNSGSGNVLEFAGGIQSAFTLDAGVVPAGLAVDPAGDIYVNDSGSTPARVLVYPVGAASGNVLMSGLTSPVELAADADANLFIADTAATGAIELRRTVTSIVFPLTNVGQTTTESISVSDVGNAPLIFPASPIIKVTGSPLYTVVPSSSSGCAVATTYTVGSGCNLTASFAPVATGPSSATVTFNANAGNSGTAAAVLNGKGLLLVSTNASLSVTSPTGTIYYGQTVVLQASVTPSTTTTTPTGTFTFTEDGKTQSPQSVNGGTVTLSLANLPAGVHIISVTYSGDGVYASSASTATFTVNQAPTKTVLTITPVNTSGAISLLFTATVSSIYASNETGTVTFDSGTTAVNATPIVLGSNLTAIFSTSTTSYPPNTFTAMYSGNSNFAGSTSAVVSPVSDFTLGYSTSVVAISQGGVGNLSFAVEGTFGGAGTVTVSCTGMPANSGCRFQPEVLTVAGVTQTEAILFYTNVLSTLAANDAPSRVHGIVFALGLPLGLGLLLMRRRSRVGVLAMLALGFAMAAGLSGCGNGFNASDANQGLVTPPGSYNVTIVFTGSNGLTTTHTVPITFTVIADSGAF